MTVLLVSLFATAMALANAQSYQEMFGLPGGGNARNQVEFSFKEGPQVFSPKDLVELARPGAGVANAAGDLVLVSVSRYSFEDNK